MPRGGHQHSVSCSLRWKTASGAQRPEIPCGLQRMKARQVSTRRASRAKDRLAPSYRPNRMLNPAPRLLASTVPEPPLSTSYFIRV
jgi:hypothetical protein